jgi:fructosamine-3-kinase
MALQDTDISWHVLRRIVHEWAGSAAELAEVMPLAGGSINTTLALKIGDGSRAVLKIAQHRVIPDYAREAHQLRVLRGMGLPAPEVYDVHIASLERPDSFLLMEFVEGMCLNEAKASAPADEYDRIQRQLADIVRALHARTNGVYQRVTQDDGARFDDWPKFYRHVYDGIWHDVEKSNCLHVKQRRTMGKIHERLERLIAHEDCPRLVHWDIWNGNVLAAPGADGQWRISALLDPNCKYAHAEAEIAYLELFHTVTPTFMKEYQKDHRLSDGYHRVRKWVYQLYPLLNDVHLFGHDYVRPLETAIEKVSALV